jgi:hypothetical protein
MLDSLHADDAMSTWWTGVSSFDNKIDQAERVGEFISFARYCEAQYPIFVGHSLFFKLFYSKHVSDFLSMIRPELSENLKTCRLGNANVLAVTVLFSSTSDLDCTLLDADLIFGNGFQKHGHSSTTNTPIPTRILKNSGFSTVLEKATSFLKDPFLVEPSEEREKDSGRSSLSQHPFHNTSFTETISTFAKNLIHPGGNS